MLVLESAAKKGLILEGIVNSLVASSELRAVVVILIIVLRVIVVVVT